MNTLKRIFVVILLSSILMPVHAEKIETSKLILMVLNDPENDKLICKATITMDNKISQEQCRKSLPSAKESCAGALNGFLGMYISTPKQGKYIADILVLCPSWTILGYKTIVTKNGVQYVKKEGGVLP